MDIFYLILLGTVIGLLSSLIGIGGGIIIVPVLPLLFNISQKESIATSLLTICLITIFNTVRYYLKGLLNIKIVIKLIIISSIGSYSFAKLTPYLPEVFLKSLLGGVLGIFAIYTLVKVKQKNTEEKPIKEVFKNIMILSSGALSGLTGIGSGLILNGLFANTKWIAHNKITPTINMIMFFTTVFAVSSFVSFDDTLNGFRYGFFHIEKSLIIFAGGMVTAFVGQSLQGKIDLELRKKILILLYISMSILSLYGAVTL